jgi:adenylate kinase
MAAYIVLLGPPGVGKGTQAELLSRDIGLPHVSSGDLFRENIRSRTPLGRRAQEYMDKGELVPDDLTIAMVEHRLGQDDCKAGAILDGFPRTPEQAEALSAMLGKFSGDVDLVPFITASPEVLTKRIAGRWTCRAHGHVYHQEYNPPKAAGVCDVDGSELYQRPDDTAETVGRRIQVYLEQTAPLIEYYRARHKLVEINGDQYIEHVTAALLDAIRKVVA